MHLETDDMNETLLQSTFNFHLGLSLCFEYEELMCLLLMVFEQLKLNAKPNHIPC